MDCRTHKIHKIKCLTIRNDLTTFSNPMSQEGVGDTTDSYSYDGNRQRKWNKTTQKYGEVNVHLHLYVVYVCTIIQSHIIALISVRKKYPEIKRDIFQVHKVSLSEIF